MQERTAGLPLMQLSLAKTRRQLDRRWKIALL
jgi:hypothetical protein